MIAGERRFGIGGVGGKESFLWKEGRELGAGSLGERMDFRDGSGIRVVVLGTLLWRVMVSMV